MKSFHSRKNLLLIPLLLTIVATGCSDETEKTSENDEPVVRPAVIDEISGTPVADMVFNGVVQSAERSELAFRVSGKLQKMNVEEGDRVEKGKILAQLKQKEFRTAVNSARVKYNKAQADYQRGAQIYKSSQAISKSDLEQLKAERDLAKDKLENAQQDLDETSMRAPMDGVIAKKEVSNYRNVTPGQTVYVIHDLDDLEVVVNVPSRLFLNKPDRRKAKAVVENTERTRLPVVFKNYSSEADSLSQTYKVVLGFTDLKGQNVLPGMNAKVYPVASSADKNTVLQVPVKAVLPTNTGDQFVWLVGDDRAVEKRVVEPGRLLGDEVVIKNGLSVGDRIVTAGVHALAEGMKVRPLDETEQP